MTLLSLIIIIISIGYSFLIIYFTIGWLKVKNNNLLNFSPSVFISVIVAVRNEEVNINELLVSIKSQTYTNFEIIFVNDHSSDNTIQIINKNITNNCEIINLNENESGKKTALSKAISTANGELIVTTDADCVANKNWLYNFACFYEQKKAKFIIGPVKQEIGNNFLHNFFSLDFLSLQASGAGAVNMSTPFICNGANLAFTKILWEKVKDIEGKKFASGDDVFLLHSAIDKVPKQSIQFLFSENAIVTTKAPETVKSFFTQRLRWASKAKGYKNNFAILASFVVFIFNLFLMLMFLASPFSIKIFYGFILILTFKITIDFPILYISSKFYNQKFLLLFYLPFQLVYFMYISIIAILSLLIKYKWKDRTCD